MSSDNDLSNNELSDNHVNDDSGNDVEFVHVPNNGLIPATNVGVKDDGANKLTTNYYHPIKDTGFYDRRGFDIGHLFATGGNLDVGYNKGNDNTLKIWQDSNVAGKDHDANTGTWYNDPQPDAYLDYFADRGLTYEGEVGPCVQFGNYGNYKWNSNKEGSYGINSAIATWDIPIPTINTLKNGEQRAKKAVAYVASSGGSCADSTYVWPYGHYYSSDGSSGAYVKSNFEIGSSTKAYLVLESANFGNTYVTIGNQTCSVRNGKGGGRDGKHKSGKSTHSVGFPYPNYSHTNDYNAHRLISYGANSKGGVNRINFSADNHPKFGADTGRGAGSNSHSPGYVGAIQVHFFWD